MGYMITCDPNFDEEACKKITREIVKFVEVNGRIRESEFLRRVCPSMRILPNDNAHTRGWTFEEIINGQGISQRYDYNVNRVTLMLSDPVEFEKTEKFDTVYNPSHYTAGRKYEPRKVIADWGLNYNLGNVVKYISRAGRKGDKIEDLKKAIQYIEFEIDDLENKED